MAFASTDRSEVAGIIPEDYSNEFLQSVVAESAVLQAFRTIPLGTKVTRMPVIAALPSAGFVNEYPAASSAKPTTAAQWTNEVITVEEIACIVPIHEDTLEDSTVDLFETIRPLIGEAFGKVIDGSILLGTTTKPTSWTAPLRSLAATAGQTLEAGRVGKDLADDFSDVFAEVETVGFDVNTVFASRAMRSRIRNLRDANGNFIASGLSATGGDVYGANMRWVRNGAWSEATGSTGALALVCDASRFVVGMRQDMTYKVLTEATVDGVNLAENDMVALRVKMRLGWAVNRGVNALGGTVPVAAYIPDQTP